MKAGQFALFSFCLFVAAIATPPAAAKDFGQVGTVFSVIEPDLLRVIEAKLKAMQANGQIDAMNQRFKERAEAKVRRPDPVPGIELATRSHTWLYDPSIIIDHDIKDHKGNLIAAAGKRVNPLDYVKVPTPLVFIDGDDTAQVSWAIKRFDDKAKLILVKGAPLDLMTKRQRRFYFDQAGTLTRKFGITHVPAIVVQAGSAMRVTETPLGGKPS
jgi:conjugal transfer pilus assembly protein TraW